MFADPRCDRAPEDVSEEEVIHIILLLVRG